jgi:F-type H+-transporting ATPase subunit gamma
MPGQLKEVRNRIKSVQSTQQITKAMKMVSAAKLRKAQDSIQQMRPYARKLQEMLSNIVSHTEGGGAGMQLAEERAAGKVLMIVITSDRGLCGAYNANIQKLAKLTIDERYPEAHSRGDVTIWSIGKKGAEYFAKRGYKVDTAYRDTFLQLSFTNVQACAQAAVEAFRQKRFDVVELVYSEFRNAATQRFTVERFLPIPKSAPTPGQKGTKADFIFEPHRDLLIAELMPKILNTQLYKAVLDANASEHGARMTAMDKASENANEMLKSLKISYNSARQAAITTELSEIVSGAAALQG